jgi:4-diphosphocytidyl-2C-methyl-D-erythritol kinase
MDVAPALRALAAGDADALGAACRNALFDAACRVDPRAAAVMDGARRVLGPRVHLTGSGSTFFAPIRDDETPPTVAALAAIPHVARTIETRSAQ